MRIEEMLTEALREDAEAHEVDVTRLWSQTRARLEGQTQGRTGSGRRRLAVLATAAAVAVAVTAGGLALTRVDAGREEPGPVAPDGSRGPLEGGVDDAFTCPEQITHDWTRPETVTDDYFAASLEGGPRQQAVAHDAPRYEYEERGDRAFLRFGNADGTLATLSEFRLVDAQWNRYRTDVCVGRSGNIAAPVENEYRLDNHTDRPYPVEELSAEHLFFMDGRYYYDRLGLLRYRRIVAGECGRRICVTSRDAAGSSTMRLEPGPVPHDVSQLFLPPDEMPGRHNPYGLWALYDREGTVASVKAFRLDGNSTGTVSASSDSWAGELHLVLEPFHEVDRIVVTLRPGAVAPGESRTRTYTPEELPWYEPRVHR